MEVLGLKEFEAALRSLPASLTEDVLVDVLKAGGQEIRQVAQALTADDHELSVSIVVRKANKRQLRAGTGAVVVALKSKPGGWRGHFREFGTSPHLIWAKGAKGAIDKAARRMLRKLNKQSRASGGPSKALVTATGQVLGPVVHHPGQRARPFLRPAAATAFPAAVEAIRKRLGVTIVKAAERAHKGFARLRGKRLLTG